MAETKYTCSFEAGKTVGKMTFDGGQEVAVAGTSDKFSGEFKDSTGTITPFTSADIGTNSDAASTAQLGVTVHSACDYKRQADNNEQLLKRLKFQAAPGLEV